MKLVIKEDIFKGAEVCEQEIRKGTQTREQQTGQGKGMRVSFGKDAGLICGTATSKVAPH